MNLVGKKTYRRKKIFTDANLRKQQKRQHTVHKFTHVSTYKILHQGNGLSSVKAKEVTSGQVVDNN